MNQVACEPVSIAEMLKVLVVDDDDDARRIAELAVRRLGHSCSVARDGLEALEMHTLDRPDIILSDWTMPRMSGLELCLRIRAGDPARAYTHFIFFTGHNDKALEGIRAGADDYLFKPLDLDQLEARFALARRALSLHRELRAGYSSAIPSK